MKSKLNFYFGMVVLLLGLAGAVGWSLYFKDYKQRDTVDIRRLPNTIGAWEASDLPMTEEEYAILETRNVVARKYTHSDGRHVYLLIVYSQNNRKVSHPPEVCYIGGGVTILDRGIESVTVPALNFVIDVNKLLLSKGNTKQIALYWFKIGNTFTPSYWKQQLTIAIKNLLGHSAGSALIRVSVTVEDDDNKAIQEAKDFSALIIPQVLRALP